MKFISALLWLTVLVAAGATQQDRHRIYKEAESSIANGDTEKAAGLLRQILEASPADVQAHNLLGIALTANGKADEGNAHFRKAIELDPNFHAALKNLALNEVKLNRIRDARVHFEELLKHVPGDAVAHMSLGEIYCANRQFKLAMRHYLQCQELLATNPPALLNFARSCFESGEGARAADLLARMQQADPRTHFEAGLMLAKLGRYEASARQFERARKGYPDPYELGFNLTLAQVKARNHRGAIQTARDLIAGGHQTGELYNLLSEAYEGAGNTLEAYNALRSATQISPSDEKNYLDLIVLSVDHANYDLALEIAVIALGRLPDSYRLLLQRGAVRAFKGQYSAAAEDFQQVIRLNPRENLPYFALAMALMEMDQMQKAIEILRERSALNRDDYLILYALGEGLNRSGVTRGSPEEDEAIRALRQSVRLNPRFADARAALGKMLFKAGNLDAAIRELEKALELDPSDLSPSYPLALALRRRGDTARAGKLLAEYEKHKVEERDQLRNRTLVRILRAGQP